MRIGLGVGMRGSLGIGEWMDARVCGRFRGRFKTQLWW